MTTLALIPARGGSKRLPRKNVRLFAGKPLLYYSIALAQACDGIDHCMVSTDDSQVAELALRFGADVIERPAEFATDTATSASVAVHALETLAADGLTPDALVLLQPNCPLRPRELVLDAISALSAGDCDSVVSVTEQHRKCGTIADGMFLPDYLPGTRTQDLPPQYYENGLVYAVWSKVVLEQHSVFGTHIRALLTDPLYALGDIDTPLDFSIAEFVYESHRSHFEWLDRALARAGASHPRIWSSREHSH